MNLRPSWRRLRLPDLESNRVTQLPEAQNYKYDQGRTGDSIDSIAIEGDDEDACRGVGQTESASFELIDRGPSENVPQTYIGSFFDYLADLR